MSDVVWSEKDGMHFVRGQLHTRMNFNDIGNNSNVRLNFRDLTLVTSHGVKVLRDFIFALPDLTCEMHACPLIFVEMLNMVPTLSCTPGHRVKVVSVLLPARCEDCARDVDVLIPTSTVARNENGTFAVVPQACPTCSQPLSLLVDPEDSFLFLTY